jgi:hypothetical protein
LVFFFFFFFIPNASWCIKDQSVEMPKQLINTAIPALERQKRWLLYSPSEFIEILSLGDQTVGPFPFDTHTHTHTHWALENNWNLGHCFFIRRKEYREIEIDQTHPYWPCPKSAAGNPALRAAANGNPGKIFFVSKYKNLNYWQFLYDVI